MSCYNNQVDVVNNGGTLSFCFDNGLKSFPNTYSDEKYYKLSNIDAKSIFPKINDGSDTILLKLDKFSVTQYITDSSGNKM